MPCQTAPPWSGIERQSFQLPEMNPRYTGNPVPSAVSLLLVRSRGLLQALIDPLPVCQALTLGKPRPLEASTPADNRERCTLQATSRGCPLLTPLSEEYPCLLPTTLPPWMRPPERASPENSITSHQHLRVFSKPGSAACASPDRNSLAWGAPTPISITPRASGTSARRWTSSTAPSASLAL